MIIKPIRVLHVFGAMDRGGAETLIMNIYRNLNKDEVQFDFLVNVNHECHYDKEIQELGGRIFRISNPKEDGLLNFYRDLRTIIKEKGPFQAIHSHVHHFSGIILYISKMLNIPIRVSHSHNTNDGQRNSIIRNIYRNTMGKLIKIYSTHMLGCSNSACESLFGEKCWTDKRVEMVPNALDFSKFEKISTNKFILRDRLELPMNSKIIGHVGRFETQKNHEFLIEIFREFLKAQPDTYLVLVGDGTLKEKIHHMVIQYKIQERVIFLGIREDIPEIMKSLDLFLFPSLYEGLGNVLIEAQAAGIPCITSTGTPRDADLNMGLLKFIELNDSKNIWVKEILNSLNTEPLAEEKIRDLFLKTGYNIEQVSDRLGKIYATVY